MIALIGSYLARDYMKLYHVAGDPEAMAEVASGFPDTFFLGALKARFLCELDFLRRRGHGIAAESGSLLPYLLQRLLHAPGRGAADNVMNG